ncbi:hypothetical protein DCO56_04415 [Sphingobacterium athyrii]|uniref:Uncharacterized protein n=2 Tax=Sphingobacteriaceae TaxID=84566 RepID=A0A363NZN9_9SPHI|nr:hypothetical protein DCO56_04415 [Sphingobacterium athyrii]
MYTDYQKMEINQDILKKYASGQCGEADKHLVEKWLNNDSWDSIAESNPINEEIGSAMWDKINSDARQNKRINWGRIIAAASVIFVLGFSMFYFSHPTLDNQTFTNSSAENSKFFTEEYYDVQLSKNSTANIDLVNKKLAFSGDFIIKPKRDFELLDSNQNKFVFKAGREYFVSNSPDFGKIVAFQKSDLAFLPSTMQIKIREQFQSI